MISGVRTEGYILAGFYFPGFKLGVLGRPLMTRILWYRRRIIKTPLNFFPIIEVLQFDRMYIHTYGRRLALCVRRGFAVCRTSISTSKFHRTAVEYAVGPIRGTVTNRENRSDSVVLVSSMTTGSDRSSSMI